MRREAEQAARALNEQARAMKDMVTAAQNTAKQIKLITHANREHSTVAGAAARSAARCPRDHRRNARGVKETRGGTVDLLRHAEELAGLSIDVRQRRRGRGAERQAHGSNGRG